MLNMQEEIEDRNRRQQRRRVDGKKADGQTGCKENIKYVPSLVPTEQKFNVQQLSHSKDVDRTAAERRSDPGKKQI